MCFAPQRRAIFRHRTFKKWSEPVSFLRFWLTNVLRAAAARNFSCRKLPKWLRDCGVLCILGLKMCFAPQRRAIFRHLTVKNWPNPPVFLAFWRTNVLRATATCHFSGSQLPKWLRSCGVLYILTYKCASRHSGVPFFRIATSKMAPELRCFVTFWRTNVLRATAACNFSYLLSAATSAPAAFTRLLFEQQEPRIIEKTQRFATSLTFRAHVSSHLTAVLLDCCCTLLFYTTWLLLHTVFLHYFSTVHIVGS